MEPVFNFQGSAMLSVMAFAGTVLLLIALACVAGYLAARGRMAGATRAGIAAAAVAGVYGLALVGFSAAAGERTVNAGGWKYFCELDCHLAYSVDGVEHPASPASAETTEVVNLRVRFDPGTVGPQRGSQPLRPSPRRVRLLASDGRTYSPSAEARGKLERALRPGESAVIPLAFRLPAGARGERLLLTSASPETRLLIGHENSFFHPRTAFRLDTHLNDRTARQ
jgi:hypothetical protein